MEQAKDSDFEDVSSSYALDKDDDVTATAREEFDQEEEEVIQIASIETFWIRWSKVLVALVLILGATLCAWAAYTFTSSQEENDFNGQVSPPKNYKDVSKQMLPAGGFQRLITMTSRQRMTFFRFLSTFAV